LFVELGQVGHEVLDDVHCGGVSSSLVNEASHSL
jgi:hypothetical protein